MTFMNYFKGVISRFQTRPSIGWEFCFFILFLLFCSAGQLNAQCNVNAGSTVTICAGQSVTLGGNPTLNNPPGNVSYNWSSSTGAAPSNTANPSVSPSVTTTYTLDVNGGPDCNGSNNGVDQVIVTVIPTGFSVTASANTSSNPITICAGSSLDLNSSVAGVPAGQNGNLSYDWDGPNGYTSSNSNPASFSATTNAAGTYTVTASIGDCEVSDNITVNVIAASINNILNGQNTLVFCLPQGEATGEVGFSILLQQMLLWAAHLRQQTWRFLPISPVAVRLTQRSLHSTYRVRMSRAQHILLIGEMVHRMKYIRIPTPRQS